MQKKIQLTAYNLILYFTMLINLSFVIRLLSNYRKLFQYIGHHPIFFVHTVGTFITMGCCGFGTRGDNKFITRINNR